jgi:Uncharacterised nucleotidyltransferase
MRKLTGAASAMKSVAREALRARFYREGITILQKTTIPFLVSGAFALEKYTGIRRRTKDLDIFLRKEDIDRALRAFAKAGYRAELTFTHWLGKVYHPVSKDYIDLIFSSGNGLCTVDADWFKHAVPGTMLEIPVQFPAPEEIIWQQAFIMERERYDGADVAHLLRATAPNIDWKRLLRRFDTHWRVLWAHLILFDYIYPGERAKVPRWVHRKFFLRCEEDAREPFLEQSACHGTFLSRMQYRTDIERWGYRDPRLPSVMTSREVANWTADGDEVSKE